MFKNLTYIFLLFLSGSALAQTKLYLGLNGTLGLAQNKFDANKSILSNKRLPIVSSGGVSFEANFNKLFSLELGANQNKTYLTAYDKRFKDSSGTFDALIKMRSNTFNLYGAATGFIPTSKIERVYVKLGYIYNFSNKQKLNDSITYTKNQDILYVTNQYTQQNFGTLMPEIGYLWDLTNGDEFTVGLRYELGLGNSSIMTASYKSVDQGSGSTNYTDNMQLKSSSLSFHMRYNIKLTEFKKKEKKPKIKEEVIVKNTPKDTPVEKEQPLDTAKVDKNYDRSKGTVGNRKFKVTKNIQSNTNTVFIEVYDHEIEDGDIISINLNGEWVIREYELKKAPKTILIELQPGRNDFILYAHNLGKYAPNTAAFKVHVGDKIHQVILDSDMTNCGTLEIDYIPE